ncbi:MAG: hypothetical protein QM776_14045 [Rhodocyclaceae bacterium]
MSDRIHAVLLLNRGYEKIDLARGHDRVAADAFVQAAGLARHVHSHEYERQQKSGRHARGKYSDLKVFANDSGAIVWGLDFAFDIVLAGKKAKHVATLGSKLLGVVYNNQVLEDAFSYYEDGILKRRVSQFDGDDRADVVLEGELLAEEIEALLRSEPDPDCDPEDLSEFVANGKTCIVEGYVPLHGCGLDVSKRMLDAGGGELLFLNPDKASIYTAKPWWKRW